MYQLTQDLTYSHMAKHLSVNSRIDMLLYAEMIYVWCLIRIIHYIIALRAKSPKSRICISEYNYSDAYRQMAHAATAAVQSIAVFVKGAHS
jgi:hypothetical protein